MLNPNTLAENVVRKVYERGCNIHCPDKALIFLRYAAFEEAFGNIDEAKKILDHLLKRYPLLVEASMQSIDLERRAIEKKLLEEEENTTQAEREKKRKADLKPVSKLYKRLLKKIPDNRKSMKTWIAMKLSRFQFKVLGDEKVAFLTIW